VLAIQKTVRAALLTPLLLPVERRGGAEPVRAGLCIEYRSAHYVCMLSLAIVFAAAALSGTLLYGGKVVLEYLASSTRPGAAFDDSDIRSQLAELGAELGRQNAAMIEGMAYAKRAQNRVSAVVGRARKELRDAGFDSPGLEAEYQELQPSDEPGSAVPELPDVPDTVAGFDYGGLPGIWDQPEPEPTMNGGV